MNAEKIETPFIDLFPGDFSGNLMQRQTPGFLFCTVEPENFKDPELVLINNALSEEIGLGKFEEKDIDFLAAQNLLSNVTTYATAYAGHQFGNWAGQLGDGRAIFAGEINNSEGKSTEIQWKGAGATPYSRFADGRAVLRSSVREYLMSEAMHFLKIKTTRALSLCKTGEKVVRDIMYNGNPQEEDGAVMIRTAESFLRFGHFELLSARNEADNLKKLTDFAIEKYFPEINSKSSEKYAEFFQKIAERTLDLMVDWYRVGFVHGVMNTDNMSILGLTIDYGPFSFLDEFNLNFTPNTTDLPGRRYAFGNQAKMAQWNLWQLANALFPLIKDEKILEKILDDFGKNFWRKHDEMLCGKFGFDTLRAAEDEKFFNDWQNLMQQMNIDYTLFFNKLETLSEGTNLREHFKDIFYYEMNEPYFIKFEEFILQYRIRLSKNTISKEKSIALMQKSNPKFILRNYLLFECIEELKSGERQLLNKLLKALENPYEELFPEFSQKRPKKYDGEIGCSMLSCSS